MMRFFWIFAIFIAVAVAFADIQQQKPSQKHKEERRVVITFKDQELKQKGVQHDTLLRNQKVDVQRDTELDKKREEFRRQLASRLKDDKLRNQFFHHQRVPVSQKVKRDTPVNKQEKATVLFGFKNLELKNAHHDTLLRSGSSQKRLIDDNEKQQKVAKRDTALFYKNLQLDEKRQQFLAKMLAHRKAPAAQKVKREVKKDAPVNKQDKVTIILFKDQVIKKEKKQDRPASHFSLDALLRHSKKAKHVAKRDTLLFYKNLKLADEKKTQKPNVAESKDRKTEKGAKGFPWFELIKKSKAPKKVVKKQERKNTVRIALRDQKIKNGAQHDNRSNSRNGAPGAIGDNGDSREKRDIASTVVGAAVSQVVANLMTKKHDGAKDAPAVQHDVINEPYGTIFGAGEVAPVANEVVPRPYAPVKSHDAPVANEIVPLPFFPKRVAPVANEVVPLPFAPVKSDIVPLPQLQSDVEVIVGNSDATTTSTATPSTTKKGFWSTLFDSIKLFFGTVTNSVGGFFIDIGQRVTGFVENRIKV